MENLSRYSRVTQQHMKQRRSGYEPSDTETDWHESPRYEYTWKNDVLGGVDQRSKGVTRRNTSPLTVNRRQSASKVEYDGPSPKRDLAASPPRRRLSKSPYKPRREDGNAHSLKPVSDIRSNVSPFSKSERRRHVSPYKSGREESKLDDDDDDDGKVNSNRKPNRTPSRDERDADPQILEDRVIQRSKMSRRSVTAPRNRPKENPPSMNVHTEQRRERTPSPLSRNMIAKQKENSHMKSPTVGEINEMVANAKLSKEPIKQASMFESTDSISPGDIFFSRDCTALPLQNNMLPKNGTFENRFTPNPKMVFQNGSISHQKNRVNGHFDGNTKLSSNPSSAISGQSSDKISTGSSKISDASGRTTDSMRKFTANRRKSQTEPWFACMRRSCKTSKSPESRAFDESAFIEKAFVVESLREFWADKYRPGSLNGFTCHKQEAQLLKQLVSQDIFPHILFKGPAGSGKRALTMALLREVFGDPSWNISHDLRYFQIQEKRQALVAVPLTSSAHHMELNVNLEPNARYALMALVKEISSHYAMVPEVSNANFKADCKVMVLYEVDKASENIQHLIKWIMDCYTDACKLILCCEDDVDILESVRSRCKVIKVDAPVTHEIMEVLIQIARKEDFDLPMSFAAKIATKSKQNLRKAIMALEACKANKYPFLDDQPIPLGWEEVLVELAAEILADPSTKRLFYIRGKFQKLLVDFVHPKLILQKLVEEFLKGVDGSLKRELYYWHAYYDKRLPTGTSALLKLEEFVAKFTSICRKAAASNC